MRRYQCENCGAELIRDGDYFTCWHCRAVYRDDILEKAYHRLQESLTSTVKDIVTEELMKERMEKIANCRQNLYKARKGVYIDSKEIGKWSDEILKYSPDDVQARFYSIAAKERWQDLNAFLSKINAREVDYLVVDFVDFLTNGRFVEECMLRMTDVIARAFKDGSKESEACHKKIKRASEDERSGIFDETLPRDVFVAYSSKDKEKAYELVEYLEGEGFSCFIAMRNLAKGVNAELYYNDRLKAAIDNCRVFALVSSKNSRSRNCDAYNIEMRYVRECDIRRSKDQNAASAHYELYLENHRAQCKPRVEYLIEDYASGIYEQEVKKFFGGLTWSKTKEGVANAVYNYVENTAFESPEPEPQKTQPQKPAMDEEMKAALDFFRQEQAKRKAEEEAKRKAEEERRRAEEERKRKEAEAKRRAEEEKRRAEEERRKAEEARKRAEEERRRAEIAKNCDIQNGVLTKYKGAGGDVVIPEGVTSIGEKAFYEYKSLTNITIPNSVKSIGDWAFSNCTSLTSIEIPNSVTSIESRAFGRCAQLTIYAEAEKKPKGWVQPLFGDSWNPDKRPVKWGSKGFGK